MLKKSCFLRFYMDSVAVHIGTYKIASASLLSGQQINMKKEPLLKVKSLLVEAYPRPSPYCLTHEVRLAHNPKVFLPLLRQAASLFPNDPMSCNKAAIINISTGVASISGNSTGQLYPYRCSKAALSMITSSLSLDLKVDGILSTAIHPGWVKTEMGGPNAKITTEESLTGIMAILEKLQGEEGSGKFYHGVRGDLIGW